MRQDLQTVDGICLLRRFHEGVLVFDDRAANVRFIIDGATGRLVMPVEPAVFRAAECILFSPDESPDAMQLMLTPERLDCNASEACDRWSAAFGAPQSNHWATCAIEGGKRAGRVFDGEELCRPNALRAAEPALCREINAHPEDLHRACARPVAGGGGGVDAPDALAVGVDPDGIDVRARFGLVRIEFPQAAGNEDEARRLIDRVLAGEGGR